MDDIQKDLAVWDIDGDVWVHDNYTLYQTSLETALFNIKQNPTGPAVYFFGTLEMPDNGVIVNSPGLAEEAVVKHNVEIFREELAKPITPTPKQLREQMNKGPRREGN